MDYVTSLPESEGHNAILTVVDHYIRLFTRAKIHPLVGRVIVIMLSISLCKWSFVTENTIMRGTMGCAWRWQKVL